jgi:hypothetical protein
MLIVLHLCIICAVLVVGIATGCHWHWQWSRVEIVAANDASGVVSRVQLTQCHCRESDGV